MTSFEARARAYAVLAALLDRRNGLSLARALRAVAGASEDLGGPVPDELAQEILRWAEAVEAGEPMHSAVGGDVTEFERSALLVMRLDARRAFQFLAKQMAVLAGSPRSSGVTERNGGGEEAAGKSG